MKANDTKKRTYIFSRNLENTNGTSSPNVTVYIGPVWLNFGFLKSQLWEKVEDRLVRASVKL
jgi:hypothetical protein